MEVSFLDKDKEAEFDYDDDCVKFWAIVDREACQCFIEGFALQLFRTSAPPTAISFRLMRAGRLLVSV